MSGPNYAAVKWGRSRYNKDICFLFFFKFIQKTILRKNNSKMYSTLLKYKRSTDRRVIFVWLGCYSKSFEDVYRTLIN